MVLSSAACDPVVIGENGITSASGSCCSESVGVGWAGWVSGRWHLCHNSECRKRVRDDAVGAECLEESKRQKSELAPGLDVVMGQGTSSSGTVVGSGEVRAPRVTRKTAEDAGVPSLQDLAESRPVQSARGWVMRLEALIGATSEVATVSCPGRLAASRSLFELLLEVVLDVRNWLEFERTCRTSRVLSDTGGAKANCCDRQLTTIV